MTANADTGQVIRNTVATYLTLFAQLASGLVVTPLIFRSLGGSAFGTYAFVTSIVGYVGILELGIGTATVRLIAVRAAGGVTPSLDEILGSSRGLYLPIMGAAALTLAPILIYTPFLHGAMGASAGDVRMMIASLGVAQLFGLLMNVYPAYVFGSGRADLLFAVGICASLATSAAQAVAVLSGGGVVVLAAATSALGVITSVAVAQVAKRQLMGGVRARLRSGTAATRRHIVRFGLKNAGVGVLATMSQFLDPLIVGVWLSPRAVAAYALAAKAATFSKSIATRASDVLVPTFAHASTRDDTEREFRLFSEAALVSSAILYPLALVAVLFGQDLLRLWVGRPPSGTALIMVLLVAAAAVQAVGHVAYVFFNGRGELGIFLRQGAAIAGGNLCASIALTPLIGPSGPALASLVAFTLFDAAILPRAVARSVGRSAQDLIRVLLPPLAGPTILSAFVGLGAKLLIASSPATAAVCAMLTIVVFYAAAAVFAGRDRRAAYIDMLFRRRQARSAIG